MSLYRHKKSGGVYFVLRGMDDDVRLEATGEPAIIYQSVQDGQVWVRSVKEFFDGRFEEILKFEIQLTDAA